METEYQNFANAIAEEADGRQIQGGKQSRMLLLTSHPAFNNLNHLPSTSTVKLSGFMVGRGWGWSAVAAGGGLNSAVTV